MKKFIILSVLILLVLSNLQAQTVDTELTIKKDGGYDEAAVENVSVCPGISHFVKFKMTEKLYYNMWYDGHLQLYFTSDSSPVPLIETSTDTDITYGPDEDNDFNSVVESSKYADAWLVDVKHTVDDVDYISVDDIELDFPDDLPVGTYVLKVRYIRHSNDHLLWGPQEVCTFTYHGDPVLTFDPLHSGRLSQDDPQNPVNTIAEVNLSPLVGDTSPNLDDFDFKIGGVLLPEEEKNFPKKFTLNEEVAIAYANTPCFIDPVPIDTRYFEKVEIVADNAELCAPANIQVTITDNHAPVKSPTYEFFYLENEISDPSDLNGLTPLAHTPDGSNPKLCTLLPPAEAGYLYLKASYDVDNDDVNGDFVLVSDEPIHITYKYITPVLMIDAPAHNAIISNDGSSTSAMVTLSGTIAVGECTDVNYNLCRQQPGASDAVCSQHPIGPFTGVDFQLHDRVTVRQIGGAGVSSPEKNIGISYFQPVTIAVREGNSATGICGPSIFDIKVTDNHKPLNPQTYEFFYLENEITDPSDLDDLTPLTHSELSVTEEEVTTVYYQVTPQSYNGYLYMKASYDSNDNGIADAFIISAPLNFTYANIDPALNLAPPATPSGLVTGTPGNLSTQATGSGTITTPANACMEVYYQLSYGPSGETPKTHNFLGNTGFTVNDFAFNDEVIVKQIGGTGASTEFKTIDDKYFKSISIKEVGDNPPILEKSFSCQDELFQIEVSDSHAGAIYSFVFDPDKVTGDSDKKTLGTGSSPYNFNVQESGNLYVVATYDLDNDSEADDPDDLVLISNSIHFTYQEVNPAFSFTQNNHDGYIGVGEARVTLSGSITTGACSQYELYVKKAANSIVKKQDFYGSTGFQNVVFDFGDQVYVQVKGFDAKSTESPIDSSYFDYVTIKVENEGTSITNPCWRITKNIAITNPHGGTTPTQTFFFKEEGYTGSSKIGIEIPDQAAIVNGSFAFTPTADGELYLKSEFTVGGQKIIKVSNPITVSGYIANPRADLEMKDKVSHNQDEGNFPLVDLVETGLSSTELETTGAFTFTGAHGEQEYTCFTNSIGDGKSEFLKFFYDKSENGQADKDFLAKFMSARELPYPVDLYYGVHFTIDDQNYVCVDKKSSEVYLTKNPINITTQVLCNNDPNSYEISVNASYADDINVGGTSTGYTASAKYWGVEIYKNGVKQDSETNTSAPVNGKVCFNVNKESFGAVTSDVIEVKAYYTLTLSDNLSIPPSVIYTQLVEYASNSYTIVEANTGIKLDGLKESYCLYNDNVELKLPEGMGLTLKDLKLALDPAAATGTAVAISDNKGKVHLKNQYEAYKTAHPNDFDGTFYAWYKYEDKNGCKDSLSNPIVINPVEGKPQLFDQRELLGLDTTYCLIDNVSLTPAVSINDLWYRNSTGGLEEITSSNGSYSVSPTSYLDALGKTQGEIDFEINYQNNNGCVYEGQFSLEVKPDFGIDTSAVLQIVDENDIVKLYPYKFCETDMLYRFQLEGDKYEDFAIDEDNSGVIDLDKQTLNTVTNQGSVSLSDFTILYEDGKGCKVSKNYPIKIGEAYINKDDGAKVGNQFTDNDVVFCISKTDKSIAHNNTHALFDLKGAGVIDVKDEYDNHLGYKYNSLQAYNKLGHKADELYPGGEITDTLVFDYVVLSTACSYKDTVVVTLTTNPSVDPQSVNLHYLFDKDNMVIKELPGTFCLTDNKYVMADGEVSVDSLHGQGVSYDNSIYSYTPSHVFSPDTLPHEITEAFTHTVQFFYTDPNGCKSLKDIELTVNVEHESVSDKVHLNYKDEDNVDKLLPLTFCYTGNKYKIINSPMARVDSLYGKGVNYVKGEEGATDTYSYQPSKVFMTDPLSDDEPLSNTITNAEDIVQYFYTDLNGCRSMKEISLQIDVEQADVKDIAIYWDKGTDDILSFPTQFCVGSHKNYRIAVDFTKFDTLAIQGEAVRKGLYNPDVADDKNFTVLFEEKSSGCRYHQTTSITTSADNATASNAFINMNKHYCALNNDSPVLLEPFNSHTVDTVSGTGVIWKKKQNTVQYSPILLYNQEGSGNDIYEGKVMHDTVKVVFRDDLNCPYTKEYPVQVSGTYGVNTLVDLKWRDGDQLEDLPLTYCPADYPYPLGIKSEGVFEVDSITGGGFYETETGHYYNPYLAQAASDSINLYYKDPNGCAYYKGYSIDIDPSHVDSRAELLLDKAYCNVDNDFVLKSNTSTHKLDMVTATAVAGNRDDGFTYNPRKFFKERELDYYASTDYTDQVTATFYDERSCPYTKEYEVMLSADNLADKSGQLINLEENYCKREEMVKLLATHEIDSITGAGIYYDDDIDKWFLNPSHPDFLNVKQDQVKAIRYYYKDQSGCVWSRDYSLNMYERPLADFSVQDLCQEDFTNFEILEQGGEETDKNTWMWDFGDGARLKGGSGAIPAGTHESHSEGTYTAPRHRYKADGEYLVSLQVTNGNGCEDAIDKAIVIGKKPIVDFSYLNVVQNHPTIFTNTTKHSVYDKVVKCEWSFDDPLSVDDKAERSGIENLNYSFAGAGVHEVNLLATTEHGCSANKTIKVPVYPQVVVSGSQPYEETFAADNTGWLASHQFDAGQNSGWLLTEPNGSLSTETASGRMWHTSRPEERNDEEESWVVSPHFVFNDLEYPVLSLDIYQSVEENSDGAVLQYTVDEGDNWMVLGDVNQGINWYNTSHMSSKVGEQDIDIKAWSQRKDQWETARFPLDDLRGVASAEGVRFRIAFASDATNKAGDDLQGFAFKNFRISQRSRVVLMEQFQNWEYDKVQQELEDDWITNYVNDRSEEVVDIRYHTKIGHQASALYEINPSDISARAMEYGANMEPVTVVDGIHRATGEAEVASDAAYKLRSLTDQRFHIDVQVEKTGDTESDQLVIKGTFTKLVDELSTIEGSQKCFVRMAIIQKQLIHDGVEYTNVFLELLPNGIGTQVGTLPEEMKKGEQKSIETTWTPTVSTEGNDFRLIVFVQGISGVNEVHQVWFKDLVEGEMPQFTSDKTLDETVLKNLTSNSIKVYPQPASEKVFVSWKQSLEADVQWKLVDMAGNNVRSGRTQEGKSLAEIELHGLRDGLYLLNMYNEEGHLTGTKKIVIMH